MFGILITSMFFCFETDLSVKDNFDWLLKSWKARVNYFSHDVYPAEYTARLCGHAARDTVKTFLNNL